MTETYLNALDASEKSCDGDGVVVTVSSDGTKLTLKKDKDTKCAFAFENTEKKTVTIKVKTDFKPTAGGKLSVYSGTKDVLLCQFSEAVTEDNSDCKTDWEKITIYYEQGNTDGAADMTDVIEVSSA